jgi:hypothetical protein
MNQESTKYFYIIAKVKVSYGDSFQAFLGLVLWYI